MKSDDPLRRTKLSLRLLAVALAALLLFAIVLAITRERNPVTDASPGAVPSPTATSPVEPSDEPTVSPDLGILEDPVLAEEAGAEAVLAAGRHAATGPWRDLTDSAWHHALDADRPVYVGRVTIDGDTGEVEGDLVIAQATGGGQSISLRFLPGAAVLAAAGSDLDLDVRRDSESVLFALDDASALVAVPAIGSSPDDPVLLRLRFTYTVPARSRITDDGGPAGFGILARSDGVTMLGHGLPLVTFDDGPMQTWGDVGAFPAAVWSVQVETEGVVVTGGDESPCPVAAAGAGCVWARGTTLRDLAIAVFPVDAAQDARDGARITGAGRTGAASMATLLDETVGARHSITDRIGPLPWGDVEVVLSPLTGAAGMEFPGLVIVDPEYLDRLDGGFGTFVVAHEVAHQWFHALLGNSSLQDPVVDESLAQYASLWYFRDAFGEGAAQGVVDRYLEGRYLAARRDGVREVAPASPLGAFGSNEVYGPMVYARAPIAWLVAEESMSRDAVVAFLLALVIDEGLGSTTAVDLRARAADAGLPELVEALDRWWFDPEPADDEIP